MIIALVAGESSGDKLGAALIEAIQTRHPDARFVGIGGPMMSAAGMDIWWDIEQLSVMGLFEIIQHVPRLLSMRQQLITRLIELGPAVFVGIDAPDFNLGIERKLKARAIPVIHYVSPTVWAWRPGRVKTIARATDHVLCLFPFEPICYQQQNVSALYTGHPLADEIPLNVDVISARKALGINNTGPCIALLPGSRMSEVQKLTVPMLDAAVLLTEKYPGIRFLIPAVTELIRNRLIAEKNSYQGINCMVLSASGTDVIAASDVVICASGTATLEVMLINRPMVVCYRLSGMTYYLAKWFKLVKSRFISLPNILASEPLVPELLQHEVKGQTIAKSVSQWLEKPEACDTLKRRFDLLHAELKVAAAKTAANVVLQHISNRRAD